MQLGFVGFDLGLTQGVFRLTLRGSFVVTGDSVEVVNDIRQTSTLKIFFFHPLLHSVIFLALIGSVNEPMEP